MTCLTMHLLRESHSWLIVRAPWVCSIVFCIISFIKSISKWFGLGISIYTHEVCNILFHCPWCCCAQCFELVLIHYYRWIGDYGDQIQKWFPANFVEMIEDGLGSLQQGSISLHKFIKTGKSFLSPIVSFLSPTVSCFSHIPVMCQSPLSPSLIAAQFSLSIY